MFSAAKAVRAIIIARKGIEEIKTEGETFDPELHEAVSSIQDENLGEKEIAQEYRIV